MLNIALDLFEAKRLAWQERKAEPFTVSPRHCGSALKGFRPSCEYAGKKAGGITLGTAMAISGAAVSPNMGYYSSPSISLLLAFFNVRLGWWLGNPGWQGNNSYATEGPDFAIKPLLQEAFGLTTDDKRYVYLSDGGHFEDLGLYEMVRRRCRFIVVVDAGGLHSGAATPVVALQAQSSGDEGAGPPALAPLRIPWLVRLSRLEHAVSWTKA